jgi:hypothetical protein
MRERDCANFDGGTVLFPVGLGHRLTRERSSHANNRRTWRSRPKTCACHAGGRGSVHLGHSIRQRRGDRGAGGHPLQFRLIREAHQLTGVSLRRGTGPRAPTRGCPSASTARRRRHRLDPDHKPQPERLKRGFELLELRAMGHREQAVDLRQMAVEPPCQFRFPHAGATPSPRTAPTSLRSRPAR